MKESLLNLEKESDEQHTHSLKIYLRGVLIFIILIFELGWLLPYLISSKSTLLVVIGFGLILLSIPGLYHGIKWSIKK